MGTKAKRLSKPFSQVLKRNYIQKIGEGKNGTPAGLDIVDGNMFPLGEIGIKGEKAFYPKSNRLQ
jgi:hypothetical protein